MGNSDAPKITPTKDLDTILGIPNETMTSWGIEALVKTKAKLQAWATQQVVEELVALTKCPTMDMGSGLPPYVVTQQYVHHRIKELQRQQENTNA